MYPKTGTEGPTTEPTGVYLGLTGGDGQSVDGQPRPDGGQVDGTIGSATGSVDDTTGMVTDANPVLSIRVTSWLGDDTGRSGESETLSSVAADEISTGELVGAGAILTGGTGYPLSSRVAVAFAQLVTTTAVASIRSGLASGGLSTVVGNVATILVALGPGMAPVRGSATQLRRLVRMVSPLRYSRHDDSDPLDHETRVRVFETVEATPGAYLSEVAQQAGLPLSTTRHHVRVLEHEDLVSGAKVRGKRRFYPANATGIELAAALNDEATASILDVVERLGAVSVSDLAEELGRHPSTVSHHLQRLEHDDIVVRERTGRTVMNRLAPEARSALEADGPDEEPLAPGATVGGAD